MDNSHIEEDFFTICEKDKNMKKENKIMEEIYKIVDTLLQKQILNYLAYQKGKFWRQNQGRKGNIRFAGIDGISDILGIIPPNGACN